MSKLTKAVVSSSQKTGQKSTKKSAKKKSVKPIIKRPAKLTLHDRLSQLTLKQAIEILGENGQAVLRQAPSLTSFVPKHDFYIGDDFARITIRTTGENGNAVVAQITATHHAGSKHKLHFQCSLCRKTERHSMQACEHIAAAIALTLEEKTLLGLADVPDLETPFELLSEKRLTQRALYEREERAKSEKFTVKPFDKTTPWTDYAVTSGASGKTYRAALRGENRGDSYCSCPDFKTNRLGTCKHIMHLLARARKKFNEQTRKIPYQNNISFVHVHYAEETTLRLVLASDILNNRRKNSQEILKASKDWLDKPIEDVRGLVRLLGKLEQFGEQVAVYPDAEEMIQKRLFTLHVADLTNEIRRDPQNHPLRKELLKVELLPYQLDGIAFAVGCGRAILADDMGLGKTIQGIGVAELMRREFHIQKVLIVAPTSVKSQWQNEIRRFCNQNSQVVLGSPQERFSQYANDAFFTICNYEQILRDFDVIERTRWDLIILDEGQRIKNWESKTSRIIKALESPYALVLSGTPLENRVDELYSIVQFVDDRRLPPAYQFFNRHRVVDDGGRVIGYQKLDELREQIRPIMLRRTRDSVLSQLPERTTEIVRIPPTDEQLKIHAGHAQTIATIVRKAYISEMDLLRLQKALLSCRMVADSTFLNTKEEPSYSTKLERLGEMISELFAEENRKAVLFSEWTTMLDLIEPILQNKNLNYVRLDGSVPQKKRQELVHRFQKDLDCKFFLATNAGATGLNLQAANTVINVDLPWNPAILEQRIGRAHRMGQKRPVQVYLLVTEQTIEENMLATLSTKRDLALAALDMDSDVATVTLNSGVEELKRRLEILIGDKPTAPVDVSQQQAVYQQVERLQQSPLASTTEGQTTVEQTASGQTTNQQRSQGTLLREGGAYGKERRERISAIGGELLGTFAKLLNELVNSDALNNTVSDGEAPNEKTSTDENAPANDAVNNNVVDDNSFSGKINSASQQNAPASMLTNRLADGLSQCFEEDADGRPRLSFTLPDRSVINTFAAALVKFLQ
ncbi:MAG: DEAD/DEAH box helicase [Planctomycetaceae bacterium]|jgi:ERCC4-related helicase|nr:DEAD/DEAH box helicase [Planctomycetaceae bacterium]